MLILLHIHPLNIYLHEVVIIYGIQWRGVCNNSLIIHLHRINGEKNYDEEEKEMKKGKKPGGKCNQTWLDLNSASLGCASEPHC